MKSVVLTLVAFLGLCWAADQEQTQAAGIDDSAKAAYFVLASSGYVFALNVAENGDVYYHMNAPASHSWMGVGFGSRMENTRMLISYISEDGHNLTNTCRWASGESEPVWEKDVVIDNVSNDDYAPFSNTLSPDGIMIAHAVCRGCAKWATGGLDLQNEALPFIFALGGNTTIRSDDKNAPLRLHQSHGSFQLNMKVATNTTGDYGRVPAPQDPGLQVGDSFWAFANYYSSDVYSTGTDAEWAGVAHAVFMGLAFLLVLPLGAVLLRLLRRPMIHAAVQLGGLAVAAIGFGLAVYASKLYNKSKSFNSTHQIIGLLVFAILFIQVGLGLGHHLIYLRSGSPTVVGKVHRFLGLSVLVLAIINGGLGLNFANASIVPYGVVVAITVVIFGALSVWIQVYTRRHIYKPEKEAFMMHDHNADPSDEYEMHQTPFAQKGQTGYVQTPRTPFFGLTKYTGDDIEDYRSYVARGGQTGQEKPYTDTPASETENPFGGRWEAGPLR